jgi:hypothetical protein
MGASDMQTSGAAINAAFVGALISPASSKSRPQDAYGNLKVPFLENIVAHSAPDAEGWHAISDANVEYSSMVGLPVKGLQAGGAMFLRLESSYLFPVCVLSTQSIARETPSEPSPAGVAWGTFRNENCNNGEYRGMMLQLKNVSDPDSMRSPGPRRVIFGSLGDEPDGDDLTPIVTIATCNLTTTHVETQYTCEGLSCAPTAVRESRTRHDYPAASQQLEWLTGPSTVSEVFCSMFINATGMSHPGTTSPIEQYIANPDVPFRDDQLRTRLVVADVGEALFAIRFAQLLNTYWTVGIAPYAITGRLLTPSELSDENISSSAAYSTSSTTAQFQTTEVVLICSTPWLIVLVVSSLSMFVAGVATTMLNLLRRGPDILDSFTSSLRNNPFVQIDTGPSTEDGPDKARRLANLEVMLGDVRSDEESGYIAVAVDTKEQPVERLRPVRRYL